MMRWYQGFGGAKLTASTEQEYMKFDINLPRERIALFLRVEADRMRNSVFREFDQERMILVEQRCGDLNRPTTPYYEAMNALVQTAHPVYWPEGHLTDFDQYTRSYHRDLYERYFIANNTTLVFVGGVTLEQMRPLVERYFGWMQRRPEPMRVKAVEPLPQAEKRLIWNSQTLKPRVEMRFMIPGIGHPDRPHFDPMAEVARLELQKAFESADLNAEINVNSRVVHTSRFGVPASMNFEAVVSEEGELVQAEKIMGDVLARLREKPSPSESLRRAKKKLRTEWYRLALDADRLAFEIGHFQVMDHWRTLKSFLETRERTTLGDVQRLAQKYFVAENRSVGVVLRPAEKSKGEAGTR
jgi:predicted Zn-dependent peptidase